MRKVLGVILAGLVIFFGTQIAYTQQPIKVLCNGSELTFDVPPVMEGGRTLVPFRTIFEALGMEVSWDPTIQKVAGRKAGTVIELVIGSKTAYRNSQPLMLDVPPKIIDGRTLVPLRFVGEQSGAQVNWDGERRLVTINALPPGEGLSELPDAKTFQRYFAEMGLGRLPENGELPWDVQRNVSIFSPGDQLCLYGTIKGEVQFTATIYDTRTKNIVRKAGSPGTLQEGGFAGTEGVDLPPGKYEYKVYVGEVLVAVFPFEVR